LFRGLELREHDLEQKGFAVADIDAGKVTVTAENAVIRGFLGVPISDCVRVPSWAFYVLFFFFPFGGG
jgi:hypothetical protein